MIVLYVLLPLLCVAATPATHRPSERVVFGIALYEVVLVSIGLVLGTARHLTPPVYQAAMGCVVLVLGAVTWSRRTVPHVAYGHIRNWLMTRRGASAGVLALLVTVVFVAQVALDATVGSLHWDGIWYHLPRVLAWRRQGHFDPWAEASWPELAHPVAADLALGTKILLGLTVQGVAYVPFILTTGAVLAVYAAGRSLRLTRWRSVMAAILFASFPVIGTRVGASSSDMAAALPILAGYLALVRARPDHAWPAFIVLTAVGVACKLTVAPFVPLLALAACRIRPFLIPAVVPRKPLAVMAVGAAFLLVAASFLPVQRSFGDLTGGETGRAHRVHSLHDVVVALGASSLHWALEPIGYIPSAMRPKATAGLVDLAYLRIGLEPQDLARPDKAWQPHASPDTGSTGLLLMILVPAAFWALPRGRARATATALWMVGSLALFGAVRAQPFSARFAVVPFAALALIFAAGKLSRNRAFVALVALNVVLLLPLWWWSTAASLASRNEGGPLHALIVDRGVMELLPPPADLVRVIAPLRVTR